MRKESWFIRLLKRIGLIKTYEISKKSMCEVPSLFAIRTAKVVHGTNKIKV